MKYEHILAEPENPTEKAAILLPGISGKALTDRYSSLESSLISNGISFLRYEAWNSIPDVLEKSLQDVYGSIDEAIDFLESREYKEISFVGKSFGGGTLLSYPSQKIRSLVLWAPFLRFSETSNLKEIRNTKLREIGRLEDIFANKNDIQKIKVPTLIIHGDQDESIPLENSQKILPYLEQGKLEVIEGAGHSYEKPGELDLCDKLTTEFLKN
tara:strand:- start:5651 stop:6289 length:639 start_codon:yes stop_codon:yes gene_type:complete